MKSILTAAFIGCLSIYALRINAGNIISDGTSLFPAGAVSENGIKGKIMVNAGVGFNFLSFSLRTKYELSSYWRDRDMINDAATASPIYNLGVDYGFAKRFSAGAAFGYQTARFTATDNYSGLSFVDSWKRIHFAVKVDYYIIAKDHISLYAGTRFGYNSYSMTSTRSIFVPTYTEELNVDPSPFTVQAHIGFSYYFNKIIGLNTELGLGVGGPYVFGLGITAKI